MMASFLQILFVSFLIIRSYNAAYNPGSRDMHSACLINDKLYFVGGYSQSFYDDVFYIDLSINFTLNNPPFINDATTPNLGVFMDNMAYAVGGADNATIFLFGGWQ